MLKTFAATALELIYPKNCISCKAGIFDKENKFLICQDCFEGIEKNLPPFCAKCGRHLELDETENGICRQCKKRKFYFDSCFSVCIYDGIIKDLIHKFKYSNKTVLADAFSKLMFDFIRNFHVELDDYDIMLPVPLHSTRLREREYNQSEVLSERINKFAGIAISRNDIIRLRNTKSQITLDKEARWQNLKDAFKVVRPAVFEEKNVLIVDDLITTGATASELAKSLKQAKAKKVSVLTLAIAK